MQIRWGCNWMSRFIPPSSKFFFTQKPCSIFLVLSPFRLEILFIRIRKILDFFFYSLILIHLGDIYLTRKADSRNESALILFYVMANLSCLLQKNTSLTTSVNWSFLLIHFDSSVAKTTTEKANLSSLWFSLIQPWMALATNHIPFL